MNGNIKEYIRKIPFLFNFIKWVIKSTIYRPALRDAAANILGRWFPGLIGLRCWLAHQYALDGAQAQAKAIADSILATDPDSHVYLTLAPIYYLQGRFEDALNAMRRGEEKRHEYANQQQLDKLKLRIFSSRSFKAMGHAGLIDIFIKGQILGILDECHNIILGETKYFANLAFIKYYEKYCSLITEKKTVDHILSFSYPIEEHLAMIKCRDQRLLTLAEFGREVQLRWEAESRPALLELTAEHRQSGYKLLHELGMPEGAWFCGLHVREGSDQMRAIRNSNIDTYDLAIEEIVRRGGWVIRMGDPSMRPLRPRANVIDYIHSGRRQDWMDVFLWAEGRFFLGTGSGPVVLPLCFGKGTAIANWAPLASRQWSKDDILLPKQYWLESEKRFLTMEERMSSKYGYHESANALDELGVAVVDNSPEEIVDLVVEMLERIDGTVVYTDSQRQAQQRFAEISNQGSMYPSLIARGFINRYPELF